jgi:hypothetical protein
MAQSRGLLVAQRIRLNTKRVVAVRMDQKVLSDVWWPIDLRDAVQHPNDVEKCLVLWLNSSLGLFLLLGLREETEGAWVQYKKPMWEEMPVLDATALGQTARENLVRAYDRLHERVADYLYNLHSDGLRKEIDDAIADTLSLPQLSPLRANIAAEPILRQDMEGILTEPP